MAATTFYLDRELLRNSFDIWEASLASVKDREGVVWSLSFQPIVPAIISKSPFLQSVIPTLSDPVQTVVIAQLTGTWKHDEDTADLEPVATKLIADIEIAAKKKRKETGFIYLNFAHAGQKVFGEGERLETLKALSKQYDPNGIFQKLVPGGFKLF